MANSARRFSSTAYYETLRVVRGSGPAPLDFCFRLTRAQKSRTEGAPVSKTNHADNPQVRAHKKKYRAMRAREDQHAREVLKENPPPPVNFRRGEKLKVVGNARAIDTEQGINTDHRGDTVEVISTYADAENKRRMVCKTGDGLVRSIPQGSLKRTATIHSSVPRGSGLYPTYIGVKMNDQFCGARCSDTRHCVDDHEANGDPDA